MCKLVAQVTIIQSILIGLYYWIRNCRFGYTLGVPLIFTPLPASLWVGIVLGDVPLAMTVGAALQLMYLGIIAPGGNLPQDSTLAALIATTVVIKANIPVEAAISIAVPIGLLRAQLFNLERIINGVWVHMADKYAEEANTRGIYMAGLVYPVLAKIPLYAIPVALGVYYGSGYIQGVIDAIPAFLMHALTVVGGMMPALGFAIIVSVIGRKYLLPYFFAGFFLIKYTGIAIMPLAIAGVIIAYLHVLFTNGKGGNLNGNA